MTGTGGGGRRFVKLCSVVADDLKGYQNTRIYYPGDGDKDIRWQRGWTRWMFYKFLDHLVDHLCKAFVHAKLLITK